MKNLSLLAKALDVPEPERILPSLEALEAVFRPLEKTIPHDVEPAISLRSLCAEDMEA